MNPSKLADRLRAIVGTDTVRLKPDPTDESRTREDLASGVTSVERTLGGGWQQDERASCFVVERRCDPQAHYGRERVSTMASRLRDASGDAALLAGGASARPPFVFFDLETTGLSGGAGTYAFLVGCGVFDDEGGFLTRQFVLLRHADERQMLQTLAAELAGAGALVTFNGKSFDAPLIETRYLFHRLQWTGTGLPHLDVLHPARRFWSEAGAADGSCSLIALEKAILGARRAGDVPGFEIPDRYFQFVRTGDPQPLVAVLEHNRRDLLSLAGLTARLLDLVCTGPNAACHAREALALGRVYAHSGLAARAHEAYQRSLAMGAAMTSTAASMARTVASMAPTAASMAPTAASMTRADASMACTDASMASIKIDALRALAVLCRRARRYEDAAAYWRELLDVPICPAHIAREASEALAVHHEHRARDLATAKTFALQSLIPVDAHKSAWNQAVQHRLARIDRKMNGASEPPAPGLRPSADQPPPRLRRSGVASAKAEAPSEGGRDRPTEKRTLFPS